MKEKQRTLTKIETSAFVFNTLLQHFSTIKNEHPSYSQNLIASLFAVSVHWKPFPEFITYFFANDTLPIHRVETNRRSASNISLSSTLQETFLIPLQRQHSNHAFASFFSFCVSDRLGPLTFPTLC